MRPCYQEIWRHKELTVTWRKTRWQVSNFSSDLCCIKTIFTFLLQIIRSEWFLTFMLNAKNCFNSKKETFLSMYLLITEIYSYLLKLWRWYSTTKNLKKQQQRDGNPCFMFTKIFVHKITVMIDDTFGYNTCLASCHTSTSNGCS